MRSYYDPAFQQSNFWSTAKRKLHLLVFQASTTDFCVLLVNCTCVIHIYDHTNIKAPRKPSCSSVQSTKAQCIRQRIFRHFVNRQHCLQSSSSTQPNFTFLGKQTFFSPPQIPLMLVDLVNSPLVQRTCKRILIHSNEVLHFSKKN